jgi:hypothetical protein
LQRFADEESKRDRFRSVDAPRWWGAQTSGLMRLSGP